MSRSSAFAQTYNRIDALINNAGIMVLCCYIIAVSLLRPRLLLTPRQSVPTFVATPDGFESQFAVRLMHDQKHLLS
jgi:NAD(P)-dependent dehydrogenase (short-subunit alcohol dehydrogenase family)